MMRQVAVISWLALCCAGGLLQGCDGGGSTQYCVNHGDCDVGQYCDLNEGVCKDGVCPRNCTGLECGLDPVCGESCGECTAPETCTAATGQCECAPVCTGRECGPDPVCGESCGTCGVDETCDAAGQCQGGCVPDCAGRECGSDGCSGSCGDCGAGETCDQDGICQPCVPDCANKQCGDDGCGGSCGTCQQGEVCNAQSQCQAVCTPDCLGRECGSDGCGGSCGACDAGAGEVCVIATGQCEVCAPDCTGLECGPDPACGASCGDCDAGETCLAGTCSCVADCVGRECGDDGCGGSCGSCLPGETCNPAGVCECVPDCANRECGPDPVCGFSCGACEADEVCTEAGVCLAGCTPNCEGRECGPDPVCDTSCGTCPAGETCDAGGQCVCTPDCAGRECGDDGCGGSCGSCQAPQTCNQDGVCVCVPDCTGLECGPDPVCGASCGTCTLPEVCRTGQCECVPDCGTRECGPDPVCGASCGTCPAGETCDPNGVCQSPGGQLGDACPYNNVNAAAPECDAAQNLFCVGMDENATYTCSVDQDCVALGFPENYNPDCVTGAVTGCGFSFCSQLCDAQGNCPAGYDPYTDAQGNCFCLPACVPNCAGRECGDDGCGGTCGQCPIGEYCDPTGTCQVGQAGLLGDPCPFGAVNATSPACDDGLGLFCVGIPDDPTYACGTDQDCIDMGFPEAYNPDCVTGTGCGASFCSQLCDAQGNCPAGYEAYTDAQGNCFCIPAGTCTPDCTGRECGDDGCGGSCGVCTAPEVCDASGQCVPAGTGQHGDLCTDDAQCASGLCLLFTATDGYCGDICDCSTGAGCPNVSPLPECLWGDGNDPPQTCYCGYQCPNGVTDCPNNGVGWLCEDYGIPVCIPGACQPDCAGRECGDDGCGGSCGTCGAGESCNATGQCIPAGCVDILLDGSFEAGSPSPVWNEASSEYGTSLWESANANTGAWLMWTGPGLDDTYAEQSVVIPAGTATLGVYVFFFECVAADTFTLSVDGNVVATVLGTDAAYIAGYGLLTADVSAYADGAAHLVRLAGHVTNDTCNLLADDASLLSCAGGPVGRLQLSEVLYDSQGGDDGNEWIEIYNGTGAAIDLSTYSLGNGGANYLASVVQLSGTIPAGGCFLVGGPNGGHAYNQVFNFAPDLENSGNTADGIALFNVPAASLTANTVPIDAVIYGVSNTSGLLDESGAAGNVDVGDAGANQSIERTGAGWAIQTTPTPGVCNLP